MTTLRIEHPITEFAVWQAAFDRFEQARADAGVQWHRICRPVDDECYVLIDLGFGTTEQAEAFLAFLQTRVWSDADNAPALVGAPRTQLLVDA